MVSWTGKKKIETRYVVEFITDKNDMEYVLSGRSAKGEPWERYQKKRFDDLEKALEFLMSGLVNEEILDIRMFEQILVDGDLQRESIVESTATLRYYLRSNVDKQMKQEIESLHNRLDDLEASNGMMCGFIKSHHADDLLEEYAKCAKNNFKSN